MPNVFQGRLGTNVGNVEKDVSSAGNVLVFGGFKLRCETVFAIAAPFDTQKHHLTKTGLGQL
jgi:hypothetical protein